MQKWPLNRQYIFDRLDKALMQQILFVSVWLNTENINVVYLDDNLSGPTNSVIVRPPLSPFTECHVWPNSLEISDLYVQKSPHDSHFLFPASFNPQLRAFLMQWPHLKSIVRSRSLSQPLSPDEIEGPFKMVTMKYRLKMWTSGDFYFFSCLVWIV